MRGRVSLLRSLHWFVNRSSDKHFAPTELKRIWLQLGHVFGRIRAAQPPPSANWILSFVPWSTCLFVFT